MKELEVSLWNLWKMSLWYFKKSCLKCLETFSIGFRNINGFRRMEKKLTAIIIARYGGDYLKSFRTCLCTLQEFLIYLNPWITVSELFKFFFQNKISVWRVNNSFLNGSKFCFLNIPNFFLTIQFCRIQNTFFQGFRIS